MIKIFSVVTLLFAVIFCSGQESISGTVRDSEEVLIGASVIDLASQNGTVTDIDGHFQLEVTLPARLQISYVGYQTKVVEVSTSEEMDITLISESELLDEVVVVAYQNKKRSNISGSVSTVTSDEIKSTPILRTEQALQGRTAGVVVTQNSGSPGSALSVRIRGLGTLQNSDPLYVVDGVIVEGIDFLNPSDISSISVLKDAASVAAYGSRGANGVVLITTTATGKSQQGQISFDAYYGVQNANRKLDLLDAREYATLWNEAYINAGVRPPVLLQNPDLFKQGTDWQEAIYDTAPIQNYQLSINGGQENMRYGLSGSYFDQEGIVGGKKSGFDRKTARVYAEAQAKPWLKVNTNIALTNLTNNGLPENNEFVSPILYAINMDPLTPVYKPDGTYAYSDFVDTDIRNPVGAIATTYDTWKSNRIVGSLTGLFSLYNGVQFRSSYSIDATFANQKVFIPRYNLSIDSTDAPTQEINRVNTVAFNNNRWTNWQWDNFLTYDKTWEEHQFNLLAGISAIEGNHYYNGGSNTNLPSNAIIDAYLGNTIDPIASQSAYEGLTESSYFSYVFKGSYVLRDRYLLDASFRRDGSSKFGPNNRYGNFYALSGGWIISREEFFSVPSVSLLKLRASYGRNGNDRIGLYSFTSVVNSGQNYVFGPDQTITNGSVATTLANPDLKWETVSQFDIGVDAEFWEGRLSFVADYYNKTTHDMLYIAPVLTVAGAVPPYQNIGKVKNTGIELSAQYQNNSGDFYYTAGGNISFLDNEVLDLGGGDPTFSGSTFVSGAVAKTDIGHPIASFYGYVTDGIFQSQEEVESHATQNANTSAGDIRFKDLNDDGVINENDRTFIGNPTPDMTYGITGSLRYKGWDFSLFLQGVQGNEIYTAFIRYDKIGANRHGSIIDRWTGPGSSDTEPKISLLDPNNNARASDRFVKDGSYLKWRNAQLGYDAKSLLNKYGFTKCRFYVSGQNLWTWTKYEGYDPEIGATGTLDLGIDRGFYPASRTFLGGIQLSF